MNTTILGTGRDARYVRVLTFLRRMLADIQGDPAPRTTPVRDAFDDELPDLLFRLLTKREYCYLSTRRVEPYREQAIESLGEDVRAGRPLRFYYDIGGGYHASIDPASVAALNFSVGLGELCILSQIASFRRRVLAEYAPGIEFHLVIDNICALLVNDIELERTRRYVQQLRELIHKLGMDGYVTLLVESEHFAPGEYVLPPLDSALESIPRPLSAADIQNVARFIGQPCDEATALHRIARYRVVTVVSEEKLLTRIHGVHMTQRATPATLCFRPFLGADSRIQAGDVVIVEEKAGALRPFLLTSQNYAHYRCSEFRHPAVLPQPIERIRFAERAGQ